MPRIPYLDENTSLISPATLERVKARRRGKRLLHPDRILMYSEPVTRGWNAMFGELASQCEISPRNRELAILLVATLTRAGYEYAQHRKAALRCGISEAEIEALPKWNDSGLFHSQERAVLALADAMTVKVQVPQAVFDQVRMHFTERQTVELVATVAGYNMVSRFLEAFQISAEGEVL